jgi:hypothetical protein
MAGSLVWGNKTRHIKKQKDRGGALALGGRCLVKKSNNQPMVGGNYGWDDGEGQLGQSVWVGVVSLCGVAN